MRRLHDPKTPEKADQTRERVAAILRTIDTEKSLLHGIHALRALARHPDLTDEAFFKEMITFFVNKIDFNLN